MDHPFEGPFQGEGIGYPLQYSWVSLVAQLVKNPPALWRPVFCLLSVVPDSSFGKESACNAGDPGSIPGLGGSAGEGVGYPLRYSWASLVAQLVKNLPAV